MYAPYFCARNALFFAENALSFYGSVALYCFQNKNGAKISLDIIKNFPGASIIPQQSKELFRQRFVFITNRFLKLNFNFEFRIHRTKRADDNEENGSIRFFVYLCLIFLIAFGSTSNMRDFFIVVGFFAVITVLLVVMAVFAALFSVCFENIHERYSNSRRNSVRNDIESGLRKKE